MPNGWGKRHATQGGRDRHPQHGLRRGERNYYALHRERGKSRGSGAWRKEGQKPPCCIDPTVHRWGICFFRNNGGLGTLNSGEITKSHHPLREDLIKAAYASYACELLDRVLHDEETGSFWFRQLTACLNALEEDKEPGVIINVFEMKILQAAGYGPEFDSCVICGAEKPDDQLLVSPRLGGALCRSCKHNDPPAMEVSARALKLLRLFARLDLTRLGNVDVKESSRDELKKLCGPLWMCNSD